MYKFLFLIFCSFGMFVSCIAQINNNLLLGNWIVSNITSPDSSKNILMMLPHLNGNRKYTFKNNGTYFIKNSQDEIVKTGRFIVENDSLFFYDEDLVYKSKIENKDRYNLLLTNSEGTVTRFKRTKTP